jgi:K+-transporting ATPase ATPase C chain
VHSVWKTSILFTLVTAVLLGLGYPLWSPASPRDLPHKAAGSLILKDGQVIGSELLAQSFTSDRYFHPRPSAAGNGYDATASGGSNLAQSSKTLVDAHPGLHRQAGRREPRQARAHRPGHHLRLRPRSRHHPRRRLLQAPRVAKARGLSEDRIRQLIEQHITGRQLGLLGEPRVNVLGSTSTSTSSPKSVVEIQIGASPSPSARLCPR